MERILKFRVSSCAVLVGVFVIIFVIGCEKTSSTDDAHNKSVMSMMRLSTVLSQYYREHLTWPDSENWQQQISSLISTVETKSDPFVGTKSPFHDGWDNKVIYSNKGIDTGSGIQLYSKGPNGVDEFGKCDDLEFDFSTSETNTRLSIVASATQAFVKTEGKMPSKENWIPMVVPYVTSVEDHSVADEAAEAMFMDMWNNHFSFESVENEGASQFTIYSYGPDGSDDGANKEDLKVVWTVSIN